MYYFPIGIKDILGDIKLASQTIQEVIEILNERDFSLGLRTLSRRGNQKYEHWFPEEIQKYMIKQYLLPEEEKSGLAVIKWFGASYTGWFSELDPENDTVYGRVHIGGVTYGDPEYGYSSVRELRTTKLGVFNWAERDYHFNPIPLSEVSV